MAYLRRWRNCHAQAVAIALASSSSDDNENEEIVREDVDVLVDDVDQGHLSTTNFSVSSDSDTESDFGFREEIESSSSESESDLVCEEQKSLREKIAAWSTKHKCTRSGINELLDIFRGEGHRLPKDARTLLQTPRNVETEDKCGGKYAYIGIESGIVKTLSNMNDQAYEAYVEQHDHLNILVNVDGIPVFKSSGTQFWPILCQFDAFDPFLVAIYYGDSKPSSLSEFLADFLHEFQHLRDSGLRLENKIVQISIKAFVCDAPARGFLKRIKGHTGYFACERCTIKGYWKKNRIIFHSYQSFPQRTDAEFSAMHYRDHQVGLSPLVDSGISCVKGICLDYMHLVCLGVVKRILWFFKQGPAECKLSYRQVSEISDNLLSFSGKLPSEFARQPRSLAELERWKATEFRQFLLYTGPVVLRKVLTKSVYDHFVSFTVAISILLDSNDHKRNAYLDYAQQLLQYFVDKSKDIYSDLFVVYNVHSLKHLADDVRHFECSLNDISAFPFENHLQTIKRLVRNAKSPITQVLKRLAEAESSGADKCTVKSTFTCITTKKRNGCFLLLNEDFAFVKEKRKDGRLLCDIVRQSQAENFFTEPCDSKLINIIYVQNLNRASRRLVEKDEISRKAVCLPYSRGYVLIPLLHGVERQ